MYRVSIQRFRNRLAMPRTGEGPLFRAYRELSRRPELAAAAQRNEWVPWGGAAALQAAAASVGRWGEWPPVTAKG